MTAPATTSPADRVTAGAAWLDVERPHWIEDIDLDRFTMIDADSCVLGQLYGSYWQAPPMRAGDSVHDWDRARQALRAADDWAVAHGFQALQTVPGDSNNHQGADYPVLADAWRAEIRRRREQGAPA